MFANIKAVIELIKLVLDAYRFISGEVSQFQFTKSVKERKNARDKYIAEEDQKERLRALRDLEK